MACHGQMQINQNLNSDWQPAEALDGRGITRTNICSAPLYPPCEVYVNHPSYQPPPLLAQSFGSTNAYRQPTELVPCRWCGGTRPTEKCLNGHCARLVPERREKLQLYQSTVLPYEDLSLEPDPRCTPCLPKRRPQQYGARGLERYMGPLQPLKTSQEPVNTKIYQESITIRDFKSPGTVDPWTRTCGDRRSFYDRFMADMCRMSRLALSIPEYGSLGGELSMYKQDYAKRKPRDLCDLYQLPDGCRSPISDIASAYATCHAICNI